MKTYPVHAIAACYPALPESEFIALRDHIKANGLLHPIVLFEEQILCGTNRDRACRELGIEAQYIRPQIVDPFEYAIGDNELRRQLSQIQKIEIAAKMANLKHGSNRFKVEPSFEGSTSISAERAAELNGVSKSAIERFRRVKNNCLPEVLAAVQAGEVALPRASETIAPLPKEQQIGALEEAKKRTKRTNKRSADRTVKSKPGNWKSNPAYLAIEKQLLEEINTPSIYPVDLPLPVNEHNALRQSKIQAHIRDLKSVEPKIAQMTHTDISEFVYPHVQFIQTYGMESDGMRITGSIDKGWVNWAKAVATKMQVRKILLSEQAKYKQIGKTAKPLKQPNRRQKDEPLLELQWKKFQSKLKEALKLFHPDDGTEIIKRTIDFLENYFAPKQ
jgi:hypothetical protein